ncbi:hypothetical protein Bbelb_302190 [Branchiostoma belcheri]|nr:hypothetical protein Bbelb_302190 [Branchiostoma belcheri]
MYSAFPLVKNAVRASHVCFQIRKSAETSGILPVTRAIAIFGLYRRVRLAFDYTDYKGRRRRAGGRKHRFRGDPGQMAGGCLAQVVVIFHKWTELAKHVNKDVSSYKYHRDLLADSLRTERNPTSNGGVTSRPGRGAVGHRGTWSAGSPANLEQRTGVECGSPASSARTWKAGGPRPGQPGAARTRGKPPDLRRSGTEFPNKLLGGPNSCHFFPTPRAIYQPKFVTLACPDREISKPEVLLQYQQKPVNFAMPHPEMQTTAGIHWLARSPVKEGLGVGMVSDTLAISSHGFS